jgi:hypothetical protein
MSSISRYSMSIVFILMFSECMTQPAQPVDPGPGKNSKSKYIMISGVYPHLATFNEGGGIPCKGNGSENGIGAITPWAGKLWMITYSPHCPGGSSDKLYSIGENLEMTIHPESVGGTPANRMIHKESNQLITGPYLIDANGKVRVIPPSVMPGRMTATARHLTDPANMVYFFDMEGMLYEANVNTLAVNKLFNKPVPGWHGKGGYTAQGQLIIANNGEHKVFDINPADLKAGAAPKNKDEMGVLASWNGREWKIIERKQFTDVTGPGGIYGAPDDAAPAWSIGWDRRSVILKLLDGGRWFTYRLPKATHSYDHWGGWYTEWPRIREIGNNKMLMDMHGMFYDFPKSFSYNNNSGITPVSSHLRYIPDFCNWNGQLVLATDETTMMENPYAGRAQSNLWFGKPADLKEWGPTSSWGGVWVNDDIKAGEPSDPFLMQGFSKRIVHLYHHSGRPVVFTLETDKMGNNKWTTYKSVTVPANGYGYLILPDDLIASWIRIKADSDCNATAFFHFTGKGYEKPGDMFSALAAADGSEEVNASLIRPAGHNKNLQVFELNSNKQKNYHEVNEKLEYLAPSFDSSAQMQRIMKLKKEFELDEASVIVKDKSGSFRLPKTLAVYDKAFAEGWPRGMREIESERSMFNAHGTLYEVPREAGFASMRPVTTHKRKIIDFCTWRGLLVMSGTKKNAKKDGHYFSDAGGLWFGAIDDIWKLGKPVGEGGVWKNANVKANVASLPYLMTGYDKKTVTLSSDKEVIITLEVDVDHNGWQVYKKIKLNAGETITHVFPDGYSAHWIRAIADKDCKTTIWFRYE